MLVLLTKETKKQRNSASQVWLNAFLLFYKRKKKHFVLRLIHPQVLLRIPCYDFISLIKRALASILRFLAKKEGLRSLRLELILFVRCDGRCVQRPETYSSPADDWQIQGIPRSRQTIARIYPKHDWCSQITHACQRRRCCCFFKQLSLLYQSV